MKLPGTQLMDAADDLPIPCHMLVLMHLLASRLLLVVSLQKHIVEYLRKQEGDAAAEPAAAEATS